MPSSPIKKMNSQSKYPRQLLIVLLAIIILATFGWYQYQSTEHKTPAPKALVPQVPSPSDMVRVQNQASLIQISPILNTIIGLADRKLSETACVLLAGSPSPVNITSTGGQLSPLPIGNVACFVPAKFREYTDNNPLIFSGATLLPTGIVPVDPAFKSDFLKFVDAVNEAQQSKKPLTELVKLADTRTQGIKPSYAEQIFISSVTLSNEDFGNYFVQLCKNGSEYCKPTKVTLKGQIGGPTPEKITIKINGQKKTLTPLKDGSYIVEYRAPPYTQQRITYLVGDNLIDMYTFNILSVGATYVNYSFVQK